MDSLRLMVSDDYTAQQREVLGRVIKITDELAEIEDLRARVRQTIYGLDSALDSAISDIQLNAHPPYNALEERLRRVVTEARGLGLSNDPLIEKVGDLAFS